jgi:predicted ferric reductase
VSTGALWAGWDAENPRPGSDQSPADAALEPSGPAAAPIAMAPPVPRRVVRVRRRVPARPRPLVVDLLAGAAGLGLGATLALGIAAESAGSLRAAGGLATALGRFAGLSAAYAMVVVVVLVARCPPLERAVGQDRLVRWHRKLGPWPLYFLVAHGMLITVGYAQAAHDGLLHQLGQLLWTYPGILAATVAFVLLMAAGVTSYRLARRRMAYETWWSVHLYTYLALFLSFSHQVHTGASFVGHGWATTWRFLRRGLWWQAHPYSFSAKPTPNRLRITIKDLGDHSGALPRLRPGTRVAIEGPYGAFTADARRGDRILLAGAGVGITPIRALLEELPRDADVVVLLRGSRREDLVLRDEIAELTAARGGRVHELVGPRERVRLDAAALAQLAPGLADRDVYVCGPDGFSAAITAAAREAGVRPERIYHESFVL